MNIFTSCRILNKQVINQQSIGYTSTLYQGSVTDNPCTIKMFEMLKKIILFSKISIIIYFVKYQQR